MSKLLLKTHMYGKQPCQKQKSTVVRSSIVVNNEESDLVQAAASTTKSADLDNRVRSVSVQLFRLSATSHKHRDVISVAIRTKVSGPFQPC